MEAFFGALAVFIIFVLIVSFFYYILFVIAYWRIFEKAGVAGWKSLIPLYNSYIQYKLTWKTTYFWAIIGISIIAALAPAVFGEDSVLAQAIVSLMSIVSGIIGIISMHKLSKSFGHDVGFTLGLIFLNPIFILMLAFDNSRYIGNTTDMYDTSYRY